MVKACVVLLLLTTMGCSRKAISTSTGDGGIVLPQLPAMPAMPDLSNLKLNAATGHVESTGATGTWSLDDGDCFSGDDDGYFGIRVKSRTDKRIYVKLVKDPLKGWNVGVSVPDSCKASADGQECTVTYFGHDECKGLNVGLKSYAFRGKYGAGRHQFDGDVSFDCTQGKAHVSGKLTVEKCSN